jgi:hypothetical protein
MKLKQGLAVAVAALAVYALPVSGAFAATPKADQTIELPGRTAGAEESKPDDSLPDAT